VVEVLGSTFGLIRQRSASRSMPDEHRLERPILLAVDQKFGERSGLGDFARDL
jgi:hypothetical protein